MRGLLQRGLTVHATVRNLPVAGKRQHQHLLDLAEGLPGSRELIEADIAWLVWTVALIVEIAALRFAACPPPTSAASSPDTAAALVTTITFAFTLATPAPAIATGLGASAAPPTTPERHQAKDWPCARFAAGRTRHWEALPRLLTPRRAPAGSRSWH